MDIDVFARQFGTPFFMPSVEGTEEGIRLRKISIQAGKSNGIIGYDESWLQNFIYRYPDSLPIDELEPGIGTLIPVGMELRTPSGFVDNVYVTMDGNIVIAECKLWRNPEARREVIAQVIDYAQALSKWGYSEFDAAVMKCRSSDKRPIGRSLYSIVLDAPNDEPRPEERYFVDAIERNLRLGRFFLLIVGDGIRLGMESLTNFLQMQAALHFTLALVELAIFEVPGCGLLVQPRTLARTLNIERGVMRIANERIPDDTSTFEGSSGKNPYSMTMSGEIFMSKLSEVRPDTAEALKRFLDLALSREADLLLVPATKSAGLKWRDPEGRLYNLGNIRLDGKLDTQAVGWVPKETGRLDLAHNYLEGLSQIVGCNLRKTNKPSEWRLVEKGSEAPDAIGALKMAESWLELIDKYTSSLIRTFDAD